MLGSDIPIIINTPSLTLEHLPMFGNLTIDFVGKRNVTSILHGEVIQGDRGVLPVTVYYPKEKVHLEFNFDLISDRRIINRLEFLQRHTLIKQPIMREFDKINVVSEYGLENTVNKFIHWRETANIIGLINNSDTISLREGKTKDGEQLLVNVSREANRLYSDINYRLASNPDSDQFVSNLLVSNDEELVHLGLILIQNHFVGSLQNQLDMICKNTSFSRWIRRLSYDYLYPERQRTITISA